MNTQSFLLSVSLLSLLPLSTSYPQYHPAYSPFYGFGPAFANPLTIATHNSYIPGVGHNTAVRGSHRAPGIPAGVVQATQPRFVPVHFTNSKVSPELARWAGGRNY